jgi:hypothetical protein
VGCFEGNKGQRPDVVCDQHAGEANARMGTLTDPELTALREFFEGLPDRELIHEETARQVTSALVELQRLRAQARKT